MTCGGADGDLDDELSSEAADASFTDVFSRALRGEQCLVEGLDGGPMVLPVADWTREADAGDDALLALCSGTTIDIGCGPGRLAARLAELGHLSLGIDVVEEAVHQSRARGASALHRDVFDEVPGEGRWQTALLADGNVGIGGDPAALLGRVRELLDARGRLVVELAGPGVPSSARWATLEVGGVSRSRPFRWAVVGVDGVAELAASVGLGVLEVVEFASRRWAGVLTPVS
ncbi:methyltransferase domain-containing protein [Nocardioides acrostichi]|uniref:Class I SAM-dependent methyltransferase n=1 Tax=Nocardioides acrostichi TaxID=2784339 RepID=A0A930UWR0_9ACTN|nr:class I SAM-dependent methyltransferase [Nocardioides acrostichi]MBF4162268.1 class I SAM-dependent methyltransferase [Nocardioides acrostichi]